MTAEPARRPFAWLRAAALLSALVLAVDALPALAPGPLGEAARVALSPSCHQMPARSFEAGGRALGACARCVGLHSSGLLALAIATALGLSRLSGLAGTLRGAAAAAGALLVADVALGMVSEWDHPVLRLMTGALTGSLILLWAAASMAACAPAPQAGTAPA